MKIVIDKRIPGLEERIRQNPEHDVTALEGEGIARGDVIDAEALIVRTRTRCDATLLEGSAVRLVGTATIGTDHIDIPWCEANGIRVVNAPGCNAPAVMQYVAASLRLSGFDPAIHTLGVVGKGHIGELVVDLFRRAGANVIVCDPHRKDAGLQDEAYLPLEEILERADAVTFHVPYTKAGPYPTHHLLNGNSRRRPGIIINASRGLVVDPALLLDIAETKSHRYIIDTWAFEDEPREWRREERKAMIRNAFIATPHIAGYSHEGKRRATEAMLAALEGETGPLAAAESAGRYYMLEDAESSFDPRPLSEALKADPDTFERLRGSHLRHEPEPIK